MHNKHICRKTVGTKDNLNRLIYFVNAHNKVEICEQIFGLTASTLNLVRGNLVKIWSRMQSGQNLVGGGEIEV